MVFLVLSGNFFFFVFYSLISKPSICKMVLHVISFIFFGGTAMAYFDKDQYSALEAAVKRAVLAGDTDAVEDLDFLKKAVLSFAS